MAEIQDLTLDQLGSYAASIALTEAGSRGYMTPEQLAETFDRANEVLKALLSGKVLSPDGNGFYVIENDAPTPAEG